MPRNPRKRTAGKIRTRWLGKNRFNPIKTRRPNIPQAKVSDVDTIADIEASVPVKACNEFGLSCSSYRQGAPHVLPQELDWSSKDWDGTKAKRKEQTKETNLLMDWDLLKPQANVDQRTDIDGLALSKLEIGQKDPKEEQINIT